MKNLFVFFSVLLILFIGCKKDDVEMNQITVEEFSNYTKNQNTCGEPLNHEGESVSITCYIHALNTFENENRFHIFHSETLAGNRVEVKVVNNGTMVFDKLNSSLDNNQVENFKKFTIKGKIIGIDTPMLPECKRVALLEIDNADDIILE